MINLVLRKKIHSFLSPFYLDLVLGRSLLRAYQNRIIARMVLLNCTVFDFGSKMARPSHAAYLPSYCANSVKGFDVTFANNSGHSFDLDQPFATFVGSCDTALAINLLEHLYRPRQFLEQVFSCLNPGGSLYVLTPFSHPYHPDPCDYMRPTGDWYRRVLADLHFADIQVIKIGRSRFNVAFAALLNRSWVTRVIPLYLLIGILSRFCDHSCKDSSYCLGYFVSARRP